MCFCIILKLYSHGQELFYKFVSKITNKLVKQLLSMTVGPEGENTGLIQIFRENVENYDTNLDEAFIGEKHTKL